MCKCQLEAFLVENSACCCVDQVKALKCQWPRALPTEQIYLQLNHYRFKQEVPGLAISWISAVSYTAALLLLIDQAPALKMEFKLLEAESTGEKQLGQTDSGHLTMSGSTAQSTLLILSLLTHFVKKRHLSPLFLYMCM